MYIVHCTCIMFVNICFNVCHKRETVTKVFVRSLSTLVSSLDVIISVFVFPVAVCQCPHFNCIVLRSVPRVRYSVARVYHMCITCVSHGWFNA